MPRAEALAASSSPSPSARQGGGVMGTHGAGAGGQGGLSFAL
jgi:hypothetical protein